jgi:V/A-type H+-transporting ATPase subunit I
MSRLNAVLLKKDVREALRRLGATGGLELQESAELPAAPAGKPGEPGECAALLLRLAALRRAAGGAGAAAPESAMSLGEARAVLERWEREAEPLLKRRGERADRLAGFSAAAEKLSPYAGLPLPSAGKEFVFLYCAAGTVPGENLAALAKSLGGSATLLALAEKSGRRHVVVLGLRGAAAELAGALKLYGFQPEDLPCRPGATLAELADSCAKQRRRAQAELEQAEAELSALAAGAAAGLAAAERAMLTEQRLLAAEAGLGGTGTAAMISGWTPAAEAPAAARCLAGVCGGSCAVEIKPPEPGVDVPVLLRPPRPFRPFLPLVTAYGVPRYGEVEPTVLAALSFLLMFGMMFGDVGHGAVVCLGGLWLRRKGRAAARGAGWMALCCGLSSVFFGFLYGSFFGLEKFKAYALWRDPLAGDPLVLLGAALAAGVAVISLGVILNTVNRLRAGDLAGAALGRFGCAGLVFYWCGVALAAGFLEPRQVLPVMGLVVAGWAASGPAAYLLRRGTGAGCGEGFLAAASESLIGAFEGALLYLANTISFVRLAAYAMSHAALLAAAWALRGAADAAWGQDSAAGILAVIAGNAAAMGLEGLVAAVQALRLEYYEFFGKFFEGGGRPFRPFSVLDYKEDR